MVANVSIFVRSDSTKIHVSNDPGVMKRCKKIVKICFERAKEAFAAFLPDPEDAQDIRKMRIGMVRVGYSEFFNLPDTSTSPENLSKFRSGDVAVTVWSGDESMLVAFSDTQFFQPGLDHCFLTLEATGEQITLTVDTHYPSYGQVLADLREITLKGSPTLQKALDQLISSEPVITRPQDLKVSN